MSYAQAGTDLSPYQFIDVYTAGGIYNATPPIKADDFNPSYVLCRASDGHVYAKFVGSPHEYIEWSIWVPKTLVTNIKGPIKKWVPKTKH